MHVSDRSPRALELCPRSLPVQGTSTKPKLGRCPPLAPRLARIDDFLQRLNTDACDCARNEHAHVVVQCSHYQLILMKRDFLLLRLRDVMLDAPEDESLERPVAGSVSLEKEPQDLTLHTSASVST